MKKLRKIAMILLTATLVAVGGSAFSQQDALYSQYMVNELVINPAYSGMRDVMNVTMVHRHQWVGIEGAPKTTTFSIQSPMRNEKVALGLYIYSDQQGPLKDVGVMANYAYRIRMGRGRLSFGVQGGFIQQGVDVTMINTRDYDDFSAFSGMASTFTPDVNFGVYYTARNWYAGVSSKHLFERLFDINDQYDDSPYSSLARHIYGTAGMILNLGNDFVLKPSTMVRYTRNAKVNIDVNASLYYNDLFMLGASYRTLNNAIVLMGQLTVKENIRIAYSYDMQINALCAQTSGSHEISVAFDLDLYKRYEKSRRYF
jgi:type IX secretion system PorP/SprF family membrane protein